MSMDGKSSTTRQLAWFAAIWACSVAALGLVTLAIRWILHG